MTRNSCIFALRESLGICRNSWSFLPIPELQISHAWSNDHLQSLNKCKAEYLHFVHIENHWESVGIGRNSWSFLPIPELQTSHGWPDDHLQSLNKCKAEFLHFCTSGIGGNWCELEGIPGHSYLFRNYKYLMDGQMIIYRAWINAKRNSCIFAHQESLGISGNCKEFLVIAVSAGITNISWTVKWSFTEVA